jgi:plasmid stabilization system protein ParE
VTRSAVVAEDAQIDILEARRWYESEGGPRLDARFVQAVAASLTRVQRFPQIHPEVHGHLRRALVKPFPYMLLYEIEDLELVVPRCIPVSRDPMRWRQRGG